MKILFLVLFVLLGSKIAFAGSPFETAFGKYKITGCQFILNEHEVQKDPECSYQQLKIEKNSQGVVIVTRYTKGGSSVAEPVQLFKRQENGFADVATFSVYGGFQIWQRTLSVPDGLYIGVRITSFIFNLDQGNKLTFTISNSVQNRYGKINSRRVFALIKE